MTSSQSESRAAENPPAATPGAGPDATAAGPRPRPCHPCPAALAPYRDLAALRHDYPLVLAEEGGNRLVSLTGIINDLVHRLAPPGTKAERLRHHLLGLEQRIRRLAAEGTDATLSALWQRAEAALLGDADASEQSALAESLERARAALAIDGAVLDCTAQTPAILVEHLWRAGQAERGRALADRIEQLVLRLRGYLKADYLESAEALTPERLARAFGPGLGGTLDFDALAHTLDAASGGFRLAEERRGRIRAALEVLENQGFVPVRGAPGHKPIHEFVFDSCTSALEAFEARLPEMAAVLRAMGVAELELDNRYRPEVHDPFFAGLTAERLDPADMARFPGCLVLSDAGSAAERTAALDALARGLPVKILLTFDDIAGTLVPGSSRPEFGRMALALGNAFVLQTTASGLYRMVERIARGLTTDAPALLCVYTGAGTHTAGLAPYLVSAAALESRAFPAFVYDPEAGPDWAARFDVADNPRPEAEWVEHRMSFEDGDLQRVVEERAFTFADFVACDQRLTGLFDAPGAAQSGPDPVKTVPLVDEHNRLLRLAPGPALIAASQRCATAWRALQELGGIDNSHARALVERERAAWEAERQAEGPADQAQIPEAESPVEETSEAETADAAPAEEPEPAAGDGEPYIETARCTSCDECIGINDQMFAYDENKQARIADATRGTFRELVEAAESCQVAIIHPGKPKNPDEPNLEALIERAAAFN